MEFEIPLDSRSSQTSAPCVARRSNLRRVRNNISNALWFIIDAMLIVRRYRYPFDNLPSSPAPSATSTHCRAWLSFKDTSVSASRCRFLTISIYTMSRLADVKQTMAVGPPRGTARRLGPARGLEQQGPKVDITAIQGPKVQRALGLMMKQVGKNTRDTRNIKPTVMDIIWCKKTAPIILASEEDHKKYVDDVQSQEMSALPAPYKACVLTRRPQDPDVGDANKKALEDVDQEMQRRGIEELETAAQGSAIEKAFASEMCKLNVVMSLSPHRALIINAATQLEFIPSCAPLGYMEHQLSKLTQELGA